MSSLLREYGPRRSSGRFIKFSAAIRVCFVSQSVVSTDESPASFTFLLIVDKIASLKGCVVDFIIIPDSGFS